MFKNIWNAPVWTTKKILLTFITLFKLLWVIMVPAALCVAGLIIEELHRNPIRTIAIFIAIIMVCRYDKRQYLQKHGY